MDDCNALYVNEPAKASYIAKRYATFTEDYQYYDENGVVFDLTGYTIEAEIVNRNRNSAVPAEQIAFDCAILDAVNGIFSISLSAANTLKLSYDMPYWFDVWLVLGANRQCLLEAKLMLKVNYTAPNP